MIYFQYFYRKYIIAVKLSLNQFICILSSGFLFSCANISAPQGGKKDETKPRLVKTTPKTGTTNFKGKEIKYVFNEWIDENKLQSEIIFTPQVKEYQTKIVKNTLILSLDSGSLQKNTTYYINLRDGIKDITEGNKADSTSLVFSTGDFLDSLTISGKTVDLLNNKKEADLLVQLYQKTDTFQLEKAEPFYITRTNGSGEFTFYNLKGGAYFLYAFKDENKNGKYDKEKESIAYLPSEIILNNSLSDIYLQLVIEDHQIPKLRFKDVKKKDVLRLQYTEQIKALQAKPLVSSSTEKIYPYLKGDLVYLFPKQSYKDTVRLVFEIEDFLGNIGKDTLKTPIAYVDTSRITWLAKKGTKGELEKNETITFNANQPFVSFKPNYVNILYQGKKYSGDAINEIASFQVTETQGQIDIVPKNEWKDSIKITILPKFIEPVSGYINDTLNANYTIKLPENYGSIGGSIQTDKPNILVQLLTKDGKIVKEMSTKKDFLFEYLMDGEFLIRAVQDDNQNKRWDQGDYRTRKMPEAVYHYTEPIKLKTNWEILDLKLSF